MSLSVDTHAAPAQNYDKDEAEMWLQRLRRIRPVERFTLDLIQSLFLVAFPMLIGAVVGVR